MAKYIDKSALVAEIEKRQSIVLDPLNNNIHTKRLEETYKSILSFINTLEVKEVQEEPVSNDLEAEFVLYLKHKFNISQEGNTLKTDGWRPSPYDILAIAKHFAKWQKEQDAIEVKEADLEKELSNYIEHYRNRETGYTMFGIAKHFFELGLKAKDVNEIIKTAEDHAYFAGSENTREKLIDKACEWLLNNVGYYSTNALGAEYMCEDLRKAMEE